MSQAPINDHLMTEGNDILACEQELEESYQAWIKAVQKFKNHLEMYVQDVDKAVNAMGKGYLLLKNAEKWLDDLAKDASETQIQVQDILREAQQALSFQN